jgi:hypothetical protein
MDQRNGVHENPHRTACFGGLLLSSTSSAWPRVSPLDHRHGLHEANPERHKDKHTSPQELQDGHPPVDRQQMHLHSIVHCRVRSEWIWGSWSSAASSGHQVNFQSCTIL